MGTLWMSQVKNKRWIYRHLTTCIDNGLWDVYRKLICRVHFDSVREKTGWIHLYITVIILIFFQCDNKGEIIIHRQTFTMQTCHKSVKLDVSGFFELSNTDIVFFLKWAETLSFYQCSRLVQWLMEGKIMQGRPAM